MFSLANIHAALSRIAHDIEDKIPDATVRTPDPQRDTSRLLVGTSQCQIKIKLSPVLRGAVWPTESRAVCEKVEDYFGYAEINLVSEKDLYAGKMCAALDRQHPRDLFDMKLFFEREKLLDKDVIKTFLVYLISHPRPIAELLEPNRMDLSKLFEDEFSSMTEIPVTHEDLVNTREELIATVNSSLNEDERQFLLSFKRKEPDWKLLDLPNIAELPAVKWKLLNLYRMSEEAHRLALQKLEAVLFS